MANTLKLGAGKWATGKDTVLSFNDENNNFKPLAFSFSRASSATVVNQSGLIETVGSGEPRIDFKDDAKGALLLEPSRTNSIFKSDDVLSTYQSQSGNVSDASESIDGFDNSIQVEYNASNSLIYKRDFTPTIGTKYTISCFVQMNDNSAPIHTVDANSGDFCLINNNTVVSASDIKTERLASTNVYRVSATKTASDTNNRFGIIKYSTQSSKGFKVTGFQLEVGSYPTSYIPTSGSAVTRVADVCSQTVPDGVIGQTEGTMYAEISALADDFATYRFISLYDGTFDNFCDIYYGDASNRISARFRSGAGSVINMFFAVSDVTASNKVAISWKANEFKLFINGVSRGLNTSGSAPVGLNKLDFHQVSNSNPFYANVKDVRVYNTRLSNSELAALTTI
jgi:hypothetical protein